MSDGVRFQALKALILRCGIAIGGTDGITPTLIDGVSLLHATGDVLPKGTLYRPALCVVVQGAKQVMFGNRVFDYGVGQALVVNVEMPGFGRITRASAAEPYLALVVELDLTIMRAVMAVLDPPPPTGSGDGFAVFVADTDDGVIDPLTRMLRLLDDPRGVPVLYPAIMQEICYWLLTGPHGGEMAKLALPNGHTRRLADAIRLLRDNFSRPLRVQQLAAAAGMSASSFHQHFKALTAMTPLQFQKQLRLLEARRLMLDAGSNAETAAYHVGYESASQFSREYARMFGVPPRRDVAALRAV